MKKHRVIYPRNSRQAKALQRWAELWKSNPEQMERRRKRGNEANARKWLGEKETARYYLAAQPSKLTPDQAKAFCIRVVNESRGRSKMSPGRCESVRKRFSGWGLWAFDFNEGVYLNHPRIEADRRRAEQAEAERLEKMDRAEAYRIEAERQRETTKRVKAERNQAGELSAPSDWFERIPAEHRCLARFELIRMKRLKPFEPIEAARIKSGELDYFLPFATNPELREMRLSEFRIIHESLIPERNLTGLERLSSRKLLAGEKDTLESVSVCIG